MAARIFLTGASGYVGGEALYQISRLPEAHQIRCLIRDIHKAQPIMDKLPTVEIVKGDLDDSALIEKEAREADVVFHLASTRHESSSQAIAQGLSHTGRKSPGYWIQISGASMFSTPEIKANKYGEPGDKVYDDVQDASEIISVIKSNPARAVDNLVLSQDPSKVKTALIPGPMIYGKGDGVINNRSMQAPDLACYAIEKGVPFVVGKGASMWSNVNIHDLGQLFVLLLQAAIEKKEGVWNENGIFLPENGGMSFGDVSRHIAKAAVEQKLIESNEVKSISSEEANKIMAHGAVLMGTNAQLKGSRARRDLGWKPVGPSLEEDIPVMVKDEAERLKRQPKLQS